MHSIEKTKYYVSKSGKECKFNLVTEKECKDAAKEIYVGRKRSMATYATFKGSKGAVPRGCVLNRKIPFQQYVHWNKEGTALSEDKKIQQVCKTSPYKRMNPITSRSKYF